MKRPCRLPLVVAVVCLPTVALAAPVPDQEVVPLDEKPVTALITTLVAVGLAETFAKGARPARRDAHAKGHGCVRADFTVDADIPQKLRAGVFATPKTYKAWIRFSNSSNRVQTDYAGDGRGMAIKLMGVPGKKILENEADDQTQDFLMIDLPTFFIQNVGEYLPFIASVERGKMAEFFSTRPLERATQNAMNSVVGDELDTKFYSMSPYILGNSYIKFAALPIDCATGAKIAANLPPPLNDPNFLRERMVEDLHKKDACFAFEVQPQTDPKTQPIENPTIPWKESEAPFVEVARIRIPQQTFDTPSQQTFCENLSYTPWHALPDERPVGGINRLRRAMYEVISRQRHVLNKVPRVEPTGDETFK